MLSPEQVKPFILHEEPKLREAAVRYLSEAELQDPDLLPMVLDACDRYGYSECEKMLGWSTNFIVTQESAFRSLKKIKPWGENTSKPLFFSGNDYGEHLRKILIQCPLEFYLENKYEIQSRIDSIQQNQLEMRLKFSPLSGEQLWEKLIVYTQIRDAEIEERTDYIPSIPPEEMEINHRDASEIIIKLLGKKPKPDIQTIIDQFLEIECTDTFLRFILIDLIGERRDKKSIPFMLDIFMRDEEIFDEYDTALVKIHDSSIITGLQEKYDNYNERYHADFLYLMGRFKLPESERAILDILQRETNLTPRTSGCMSLCGLFSEVGLSITVQQIADGFDTKYYNNKFFNLLEALELSVAMLGLGIPNVPGFEEAKAKF